MAMVVKNNMSAVRTLNTLNANSSALQKSLNRVSSGMKINSAQDDAAGYAISERMRVRIRSLDQANQNTQNDSSLMKTAEGAVSNTVEILRALKEKAINAANDSNTDEDRQTIQKEINQFIDQIDDNALVQFNGKYLVDGSKNNATTETKTILLNQSLSTDSYASTALTDLKNRAGDSLGIQETDKWQVSWVQNGTIHTTSGDVLTKNLDAIIKESTEILDDDGNKTGTYVGTVARTTEVGLINSTEQGGGMDGYVDSGMTLEATKVNNIPDTPAATDGLDLTDVQSMFSNFSTSVITEAGTITGYAIQDADGNPQEVSIEISKNANSDAGADKYFVKVLDENGKEVSITEDTKLHQKAPTGLNTTYTDATTADTAALAYPTTSTLNLTTASCVAADGYAIPTELSGKLTATPQTLGSLGFYEAVKDTDGNITGFKAATGTVASGTNSGSPALVLTGGITGSGSYYTLDTSQLTEYGKFTGATPSNEQTLTEDPPSTIAVKDRPEETAAAPNDPCDKFKKDVYTPDKTPGIAFVAGDSGVKNQISGLTINILDQDGNVKKAANAALDQFKQYQRAENQTGDMSLNFHIGSEANVAIKVGLSDMRSEALGLKGSNGTRIDVYTKEHANAAINVIENALTKALDQQTTIGAIEARLEYTSTNLTTSSENVQAAESTIRDADMAKEMTNYTKSNVLLQAAQAMLAQANQNSSAVLSLLQ